MARGSTSQPPSLNTAHDHDTLTHNEKLKRKKGGLPTAVKPKS